MKLTPEAIAHLARLAGLELSARDLEVLPEELGRVLAAVRRLAPASPAGPVETTAPSGTAPPRADHPRRGLGRAAALGSAAHTERGCFVVPPILEGPAPRPRPTREETG